jgi:PTH1 family peptidyl-tRNA hydrolase
MNASGRSVAAAMGFYKLEPASLLVVHDELDLPLGTLRLKLGGGDAGHKGIRSVQSELGTPEFARLRVGVGHPRESTLGEAADYVLEAIPPAERLAFEEAVARAAEAVELFLSSGLSVAMNQVNQRMRRC